MTPGAGGTRREGRPQACIPLRAWPVPAPAPGSWLTPALHVWNGWGSSHRVACRALLRAKCLQCFLSPCKAGLPRNRAGLAGRPLAMCEQSQKEIKMLPRGRRCCWLAAGGRCAELMAG